MLDITSDDTTNDIELSTANKLLSNLNISYEELKVLNSPKIIENYRSIYVRIM